MKRILTSPLHWPLGRWFAVIEWTGRTTGRRYATPVSYFPWGSEIWITTGDAWWRNLRENPEVRVCINGRWHRGVAQPVLDETEAVERHRTMFQSRPSFARLAALAPRPSTSEIAQAVRAGRVLVRVSVEPRPA